MREPIPIPWKKICCPVDYSEASRAALRVAVDLCRRTGAELTVLHVSDAEAPDDPPGTDWAREAADAGVEARVEETAGDPKTAIAEWSETHGTDAIVMGTNGRTGRARSLFGSVAENTVRRAHCPVMVVHPDWERLH